MNQDCLVTTTEYEFMSAAKALALQLHLTYREETDSHDAPFTLHLDSTGLSLHSKTNELGGPLKVDFIHGRMGYRRQQQEGRKLPLAKAIGIKKDFKPSVIDTTAGLGRDAFVLAQLGCDVTLIERSAILHALLNDGLTRAAQHEATHDIIARMHLIQTDAITFLQQNAAEQSADVIYLDPMYPERKKSALVKKEMRYLQAIVGKDSDANELLNLARQCAKKRVVVKRPIHAETITETKTDLVIKSKSTRYDIYFCSP